MNFRRQIDHQQVLHPASHPATSMHFYRFYVSKMSLNRDKINIVVYDFNFKVPRTDAGRRRDHRTTVRLPSPLGKAMAKFETLGYEFIYLDARNVRTRSLVWDGVDTCVLTPISSWLNGPVVGQFSCWVDNVLLTS